MKFVVSLRNAKKIFHFLFCCIKTNCIKYIKNYHIEIFKERVNNKIMEKCSKFSGMLRSMGDCYLYPSSRFGSSVVCGGTARRELSSSRYYILPVLSRVTSNRRQPGMTVAVGSQIECFVAISSLTSILFVLSTVWSTP